ncbi:MAG: glycoside hydrolase family 5 protein [Cyclobacteriaceae bacterium]
MKNIFLPALLILLFSCKTNSNKTFEKFEVKKGTNVAHWLSQSSRRGEKRLQFFTEMDVKAIAAMGFDHIRLPIDEEQMWDEDGQRHPEAFELLTNCLDWCTAHNLRVIVDLHILRSHHFNKEEKPLWTDPAEQEKFYDLWRDLSSDLKDYPNGQVAYELMNEAVADDPELWNNLVASALAAIRELEPERTIVIGSNRWQSVNTFDDLKVPENDPNILLSFHFYEPFLLTHYDASWTGLKDYEGPVHYPGEILTTDEYNSLGEDQKKVTSNWVGKEFSRDVLLEMWQEPIRKARKLGLPLYCGEFGIISGPPEEDRLKWYKDMISLFGENGIGYANWNYKSNNFGFVDSKNQVYQELAGIVSGSK